MRSSIRMLLPNSLSLARLAMGIVFPWAPAGWRVGLVLAAAASDLLDGAISRMMRASSTAGQIIDPIADKVFAMSVLVTLVNDGPLLLWQLLVVAARDWLVAGGTAWVCFRHGLKAAKALPPTWLGKITTALQFAFILSVLYFQGVVWWMLVPAGFCSVVAGIDYLRRNPS